MNTRVFTPEDTRRISERIRAVVKTSPGIPLALLCRTLNGQPATEWCGLCEQYATIRKRERAKANGQDTLWTLPAPYQLHEPCPGIGFDNIRKSAYALNERGILRLEREQRKDTRQPRGWDWMTCCYLQPAARVALVGCVAQKQERKAPARELYTSPLWRYRLAWAEQHADQVLVLSAKHHLVALDQELEPYDASLNTMSKAERLAWSTTVWGQLHLYLSVASTHFVLLAGKAYTTYLRPWLEAQAAGCEAPLRSLSIGQQIQWLKANCNQED